MTWTIENVKRHMWPHVHIQKGGQRICAKFLELPKDVKHGDKIGKGVFRLIENDLYEDEFYQYALPIVKELWLDSYDHKVNRCAC